MTEIFSDFYSIFYTEGLENNSRVFVNSSSESYDKYVCLTGDYKTPTQTV